MNRGATRPPAREQETVAALDVSLPGKVLLLARAEKPGRVRILGSAVDVHLLASSPCIDAGHVFQIPGFSPFPALDFDGSPNQRVIDKIPGPAWMDPDMGADEVL